MALVVGLHWHGAALRSPHAGASHRAPAKRLRPQRLVLRLNSKSERRSSTHYRHPIRCSRPAQTSPQNRCGVRVEPAPAHLKHQIILPGFPWHFPWLLTVPQLLRGRWAFSQQRRASVCIWASMFTHDDGQFPALDRASYSASCSGFRRDATQFASRLAETRIPTSNQTLSGGSRG